VLAADISLQEKPEAKTLLERNREAVNERLRELGLVRCDTIGDGNCQFVALAFSSDKGVDQAIQGENYIYITFVALEYEWILRLSHLRTNTIFRF
jgi:hypothetical protein